VRELITCPASLESVASAPVVYGYGNFAILIQSETFSSTPYLIIWKYGLRYPNPKPLNQLHISQYYWYCLFCLTRQKLWLFCLLSDKSCWSGHMTSRLSNGSSVQFALPNFPGDDVVDDVIDGSWWREKVTHQNWWWRHYHVMRYLSKLTAYTCRTAFISACLYGVPQLI